MMEMEMASHGSASFMMKQTQHGNYELVESYSRTRWLLKCSGFRWLLYQ